MVRTRLLTIAVAALGALACVAPAAAEGSPAPVVGYAYGNFTLAGVYQESYQFVVVDRGLPQNDMGWAHYCNNTVGFCYTAKVDCVSVSGNIARYGYVIPNQPNVPPGIVGLSVVAQVQDNDTPSGVDQAGDIYAPGSALSLACDTAPVPTRPVASGYIEVTPVPPGDSDESVSRDKPE